MTSDNSKTLRVAFLPATQDDIPSIIKLAQQIWRAYYPAIIGLAQVEYMLAQRYTEKEITSQMQAGERYYVALGDNQMVGYASLRADSDAWFLHQLYVLPSHFGFGIGTGFLHFLFHEAGYRTIRLQVNRKNIRAINFYFKNGFVIERCIDVDIGNGYYMNDYVMVKKFNQ
ncbi:MAG: GNAT family N-acetyltransferase [Chitinophagales bacterium]|nr:GNAT family N-acetyltransferase [Chitinophagales bacterium]MDW8419955.1 GNAT family N-acetyltransferase [Chitinophagales bacterium]